MNYLDIVIIIPLIWAVFKGFKKGLIIELFSLIAIFAGVWAGIFFSDFVSQLLIKNFNLNPQYTKAIAFLIIFIGIIIVVHIIAKTIEKLVDLLALSFINKLAGAFFSLLKTAFIISIIFFIISKFDTHENIIPTNHKEKSFLYRPVSSIAPLCIPIIEKKITQFNNEKNNLKE